MSSTLRVGIAGLGRMGRSHARNLAQRTRGAALVAACGPTADERLWAQRELGIDKVYEDYGAMLREAPIDAVAIVTPTTLHAEQAIAALDAGKHVFLEKPLALEVAACERVMAAAARHPQQVVLVGFVRRFDASYRQAKADINAGLIGKPFLVRSQSGDMNDPDGFFVRFAPTSGGIFMDVSVHDVDVARWMLGNPRATRVFASGTIALHPALSDCGDVDNGLAIIEFEGGARAMFHASRTLAHGNEMASEIFGTAGSLQVGVGAHRDRVQVRDAHGVRHRATSDFYERFEAAFLTEMEAFVAACRGEQALAVTLADATEATRIGVALARSLKSGQVEAVT